MTWALSCARAPIPENISHAQPSRPRDPPSAAPHLRGTGCPTHEQIGEVLPDIPAPTLYRQLRVLLKHGIVHVVGRRTINGIVERTYAVKRGTARFRRTAFAAIGSGDHVRYLGVLLATQIAAAQSYFAHIDHDVIRDGTTYFSSDLPLTDREARALRRDLLRLTARYRRPAGSRRRVRHVAVSLLPDPPAVTTAGGQ
jgi:hypothetical protein